jgi:hypothetical protein
MSLDCICGGCRTRLKSQAARVCSRNEFAIRIRSRAGLSGLWRMACASLNLSGAASPVTNSAAMCDVEFIAQPLDNFDLSTNFDAVLRSTHSFLHRGFIINHEDERE